VSDGYVTNYAAGAVGDVPVVTQQWLPTDTRQPTSSGDFAVDGSGWTLSGDGEGDEGRCWTVEGLPRISSACLTPCEALPCASPVLQLTLMFSHQLFIASSSGSSLSVTKTAIVGFGETDNRFVTFFLASSNTNISSALFLFFSSSLSGGLPMGQ
jgi:hypothetical protein